jgi:hypothetical protein
MRMHAKLWLLGTAVVSLTACSGSEPPANGAVEAIEAAPAPSVFDPLVGTIDRAKGVQSTVDDQAAEQRRRIEQAER